MKKIVIIITIVGAMNVGALYAMQPQDQSLLLQQLAQRVNDVFNRQLNYINLRMDSLELHVITMDERLKNIETSLFNEQQQSKALQAAQALREAGDFVNAEKAYLELLVRYPRCLTAINNLSILYGIQNKFSASLETIKKALEFAPQDQRLITNRRVIADRLNQWALDQFNAAAYDEAQKSYELLLRFDPENSEYVSNLGVAYAKQGDLVKAETFLKKALMANPRDIDTLVALASINSDRGDLDAAEELCTRCLRIDPTHSKAREYLEIVRKHRSVVRHESDYDNDTAPESSPTRKRKADAQLTKETCFDSQDEDDNSFTVNMSQHEDSNSFTINEHITHANNICSEIE